MWPTYWTSTVAWNELRTADDHIALLHHHGESCRFYALHRDTSTSENQLPMFVSTQIRLG
jgi:hypothetical protein